MKRLFREFGLGLLIALLCGAPAGCETPKAAAIRAAPSHDEIARVIRREDATFSDAIYYKPDDETPEAVRRMAPLIVQGVPNGSTLDQQPRIAPGTTQESQPTIGLSKSTATVAAGSYGQWVWSWHFAASEQLQCERGQPVAQAVRMTLDAHGSPVIWEVVDCREHFVVVLVSRSLEAAASRAYGAALPGRRFAVERSTEEQPDVIVAGVLEDGPEPMGPFVYLDEACRITTILCRCMPARFENAVETLNYRIESLEALASQASLPEQTPWNREWLARDWLEKALRLPSQL